MNKCPHFDDCGGCVHHLDDYVAASKSKQQKLIKEIGRFGFVEPMITMENPFGYRQKAVASFGYKNNKIFSGFYARNSRRLVEINHCAIENPVASKIIKSVTNIVHQLKFTVYNEQKDRGFLRHIMVRTSVRYKEVMVILVGAEPFKLSRKIFVKRLRERHPEITTIIFNYNPRQTSYVLGKQDEVLFGPGFIFEGLFDKKFKLSPQSFFQVNPPMMEQLLTKAFDLVKISKQDVVVDAYSGTGVIGIIASDYSDQVFAVEGNPSAVRDSINNARYNKSSMTTIQKDATEALVELAQAKERVDVVIMDPSREGSTEAFLDALNQLLPDRILYISCYPPSLSRDLDYLLKKDQYKVDHLIPVDMFPFTDHVECVTLMSRAEI